MEATDSAVDIFLAIIGDTGVASGPCVVVVSAQAWPIGIEVDDDEVISMVHALVVVVVVAGDDDVVVETTVSMATVLDDGDGDVDG